MLLLFGYADICPAGDITHFARVINPSDDIRSLRSRY